MVSGARHDPFPHAVSREALPPELAERTLCWFEGASPWRLRIASFFEQWEMHLDKDVLPDGLEALLSRPTVAMLKRDLLPSAMEPLDLVELTAHRMVAGQTIRIHNDHRPGGETHRVLVQLNRGWSDERGGLLMLFESAAADDVRRMIRPIHGSGLGFGISERSFHAVSTISAGERFTLVYSFRERCN